MSRNAGHQFFLQQEDAPLPDAAELAAAEAATATALANRTVIIDPDLAKLVTQYREIAGRWNDEPKDEIKDSGERTEEEDRRNSEYKSKLDQYKRKLDGVAKELKGAIEKKGGGLANPSSLYQEQLSEVFWGQVHGKSETGGPPPHHLLDKLRCFELAGMPDEAKNALAEAPDLESALKILLEQDDQITVKDALKVRIALVPF
jgi:hypothetical protein